MKRTWLAVLPLLFGAALSAQPSQTTEQREKDALQKEKAAAVDSVKAREKAVSDACWAKIQALNRRIEQLKREDDAKTAPLDQELAAINDRFEARSRALEDKYHPEGKARRAAFRQATAELTKRSQREVGSLADQEKSAIQAQAIRVEQMYGAIVEAREHQIRSEYLALRVKYGMGPESDTR